MTHPEMIAVLQAHAEGKRIEARMKSNPAAIWGVASPTWNFDCYDYRVKREAREFWLARIASSRDWIICGVNQDLVGAPEGEQIHVREVIQDAR